MSSSIKAQMFSIQDFPARHLGHYRTMFGQTFYEEFNDLRYFLNPLDLNLDINNLRIAGSK